MTSAATFVKTLAKVEFSFNWFYADDRDIALFSSGRLPVRAPGTDPALPTQGTGEFEWMGFLPRGAACARGESCDGRDPELEQQAGANVRLRRLQLLVRARCSASTCSQPGIAMRKKHTLASVVSVMNAAATQDLRVVRGWPLIRAVLAGGAAPTQRAEAAARPVDAWRARGGSRIDLQLDGKIDDPGAAVLDAAWTPLTEAVLSPVLGTLTSRLERLMPRDDAPGRAARPTSRVGTATSTRIFALFSDDR